MADNRLQAPLKLLREQFQGIPKFTSMERGEIQASSRAEVTVSPRQPDQEIYGFILFETTENGHNVPIALYFSIPNEYSKRLPWYGIEMYSHNPYNVMEAAMKLPKVSQMNSENTNFSYPEKNDVITKVNKHGLALTAFMYRLLEEHKVIVKLIVHKVWAPESTFSKPSTRATSTSTHPTTSKTTTTATTDTTTTTTTSATTFPDYVRSYFQLIFHHYTSINLISNKTNYII